MGHQFLNSSDHLRRLRDDIFRQNLEIFAASRSDIQILAFCLGDEFGIIGRPDKAARKILIPPGRLLEEL